MHGEASQLLLAHLQADRHDVETAPRIDRLAQAVDVRRGQKSEIGEPRQGRVEIRGLLADDLELVGGPVERDGLAVAVVDQAARRGHRVDADAIALRELAEVIESQYLEVEEPHYQCDGAERHDQRHGDQPPPEQPLLGPLVLQAHGA